MPLTDVMFRSGSGARLVCRYFHSAIRSGSIPNAAAASWNTGRRNCSSDIVMCGLTLIIAGSLEQSSLKQSYAVWHYVIHIIIVDSTSAKKTAASFD